MNPQFTPIKCWLDALLAFIYPSLCQICGAERATPAEGFVGCRCWQQVRFIQPPYCERCGLPSEGEIAGKYVCGNCREMKLYFHSARSAVAAKGLVLDILHRYKYQQARWFEPFLADLLVRQAKPALPADEWQWIVPVPLHRTRQREREFNQAERLARYLSRATLIPIHTGLISRVQPTTTQTRLNRSARAANMRQAFAARNGVRLAGERIVLVDDVFTTGATTNACAQVLRAIGASTVCVWTTARGL